MFRNDFGILSVRPVKKSQRKRRSLNLNVTIENLSNVSHENSQSVVTSENIQDIGAAIKTLWEKAITSKQENPETVDMTITNKNTASTDCLVNPTTSATPNPRKVSSYGLENSLSSQCDVAVKCNNSCFIDHPMFNVSECAENLLPTSSIPDDNFLAKPSIPEKNMHSSPGLGLIVAESQKFVAFPIELQQTPISTLTVSGSDEDIETPKQIAVEMSVTSELNNPKDVLHVSDMLKIDSYTSEVSTSFNNHDSLKFKVAIDESIRRNANEIVDQSCSLGESLEVQTTTDKDPLMINSDLMGQHVGVSDSKSSPDCDIISVVGSPVTCAQMSILANEKCLIKYLTDHDNTPCMPEWTETDVGSPSKVQSQVSDTESSLPKVQSPVSDTESSLPKVQSPVSDTESSLPKVHRTMKDTESSQPKVHRTVEDTGCSSSKFVSAVKDTKILEHPRITKKLKKVHRKRSKKKVPKMTAPPVINETCFDCIWPWSSSQNQFSESMQAVEMEKIIEQSNESDNTYEYPGNQVHIETEITSNDKFASAVLGNAVRIKMEPEDDAVCTSAESQIKEHSTNPRALQSHCPQSLSRTTTGAGYLTDGATRKRKHTDMISSNEYVNSDDSQQSHQLHQLPGPLSTAVASEQNNSFFPFKIQSVFSLTSHSHNMSIQDIVNIEEKDRACKAIKFSKRKKPRISCPAANSNQKIPKEVILSKEIKSDPRLRSSCYVIMNRLRGENVRIEGSESSRSCKCRILSGSKMNEDAPDPQFTPKMRTETGSSSASVNSSGTRYAYSTFIKVPATLPVIQPKVYLTSTLLPRTTQMSTDPSKEAKKYCIINVQGKNLIIPSVTLNNPLSRPKLNVNKFPGMQLPKVSSGHHLLQCCENLKSQSNAADQLHNVPSATNIGSKSIMDSGLLVTKELNRNVQKHALKRIETRRNVLYGIAAKSYGLLK